MRQNANETGYDAVTIFGIPALFSDYRIDRAPGPPGMYLYELRHEDEDWGTPCQIARGILVNFFGTILTAEPLTLPEDGYRDFESSELVYIDYNTATIPAFLAKYGMGAAS